MSTERFSDRVRGDIPYHLIHIPVADLREGARVGQCFLVKKKTQRSTRTGDPYLEILLADRTGVVQARAWADATQRYASQFEEGDFVFAQARVETYRNALQLIIESIRRLTQEEQDGGKLPGFDPTLLVPTSEHDIEEMWSHLLTLASSIEPDPLRVLTESLLREHADAFRQAPAAVSNHHAYLGGLLEHTLEVAQGVARFADDQPSLGMRRGLAISGAILHDVGKLLELENPIAPRYSLEGQLIGHLLLGRDMVRAVAATLTWPDPRLPLLLEHILISHHGELEYAAAMVPKVSEAVAVYHFDNLSAKLNMIKTHIASDAEEGDFTDWERNMERRFFKGTLADA
ncbi:MAG: OB-fold nucleic acid binding domain-containing protein [Candidatus Bipolaricaulis sp.]|nr:OB-fold nucleic acid binding domain-containing protein [Candidatus Bipolaricaulis sp.]MDD5219780.1 OB-fold nucleic acid binding domain-containing protein [Candidatus Bipolaricaulis sp.]